MVKYIKFALVGETKSLVYRNTGQYYNKKYTIKGNTVYGANGRKIGNIGKPTKAQQQKIDRAKKNREKKLKHQIKKFGRKPDKNKSLGFRDLAEINETTEYVDVPLERYQQELLNLGTIINDAVNSGKITPEEGQSFLDRWVGAKNDSERRGVWQDLKKFFKDRGYQYE